MTKSTAEQKWVLYQDAVRLFNTGNSHPQIVDVLKKTVDYDIALVITDKAFKEEWGRLQLKAARLLNNNKTWFEVVDELSKNEQYRDVVELIVNDIYKRDFDVSHAEDVFKRKSQVWGYLLILGIIQLVHYLISPYNKYYFALMMAIGVVGLIWGVWEFFFNKKHDNSFNRYIEHELYKGYMKKTNRIEMLFLEKQRKVLNVYSTAGYPELSSTLTVMKALQNNGVDIIELGMPYSDPLADGPVIQESGSKALANGMTIATLFEQLNQFRNNIHLPVILMGYMNPVLQYGFEKFCNDAAAVGVDGLILPDLPEYEFETEYGPIIQRYGLDFIFLVTPETSEERVRKLDSLSTGFLYAVSSSSTTGKDKNMTDVSAYLKRLKSYNLKNPVLVGFGIKDKETFETACEYANGAIIGTAYINALGNATDINEGTKSFLQPIIS